MFLSPQLLHNVRSHHVEAALFLGSRERTNEYRALVAEVDIIQSRRDGMQGQVAERDAERLRDIERRLVQLITSTDELADDPHQGLRLFCDLEVKILVDGKQANAVVADIGNGGVFLGTDFLAKPGQEVTLVMSDAWPFFRGGDILEGKVTWVADGQHEGIRKGLGVAFAKMSPQAEASLRLQIIALLRTHVDLRSVRVSAVVN